MKKSLAFVLLGFVFGVGLLASCGPATPAPVGNTPSAATAPAAVVAPKKGGTLTIGLASEPPTMDPHASPSAITFYITGSTAESLLFLTEDRKLQPWLATSWTVEDGGKTFTFKLRNDVKFQDGEPFNATAVKWNFDRIVDPNYKAGGSLTALVGYDKTEVVDDYTVRVRFKTPNAPFLVNAAGGTLAMLSPKGTQGQGDKVNDVPIFSGPYKITSWEKKSQITIERWDGYNRKAPWSDNTGPGYLDKIIWKFIPENATRMATVESGETQMVEAVPSQDLPRLEGSKDLTIVKKPWTGAPRFWALNVTKPPTDDLKVRQAIEYAVDKDAIINTIYKGGGTKGFAPMTAIMLDDPALRAYYPFDLNKAKQLLEDAGWKAGSDGIRVKNGQRLELLINDIDQGTGPQQLDILLQGQLKAAGFDVKLKTQARAPWYEDNYKCSTNGPTLFLRSGDLDGLTALYGSQNVGTNFNWSCIKDPALDKLLDAGRAEGDTAKRNAIYLDLEKKIMDQALVVPILDELSVWAVRNTTPGLKFNGYTYPIVSDVSIKQ